MHTEEQQIGKQASEGKETKGINPVFLESNFSVCSFIGGYDSAIE